MHKIFFCIFVLILWIGGVENQGYCKEGFVVTKRNNVICLSYKKHSTMKKSVKNAVDPLSILAGFMMQNQGLCKSLFPNLKIDNKSSIFVVAKAMKIYARKNHSLSKVLTAVKNISSNDLYNKKTFNNIFFEILQYEDLIYKNKAVMYAYDWIKKNPVLAKKVFKCSSFDFNNDASFSPHDLFVKSFIEKKNVRLEKILRQLDKSNTMQLDGKDKFLIERLLRGYRMIDLDFSSLWGSKNKVNYDEITQGAIGDCYLIGALAAIAYLKPDFVKEIVKKKENGVYSISFAKEKIEVKFTAKKNKNNYLGHPLWVATTELALAKKRKKDRKKPKSTIKDILSGGKVGKVFKTILGEGEQFFTHKTTKEDMLALLKMAEKTPVVAGSSLQLFGDIGINLVGSHAYTVLGMTKDNQVLLRNTYGMMEIENVRFSRKGRALCIEYLAGDSKNDGVFEINTDLFLEYFNYIGISPVWLKDKSKREYDKIAAKYKNNND